MYIFPYKVILSVSIIYQSLNVIQPKVYYNNTIYQLCMNLISEKKFQIFNKIERIFHKTQLMKLLYFTKFRFLTDQKSITAMQEISSAKRHPYFL